MTRLEFAKGWLFLTAQPWGKAYRTTEQTSIGGEPSPADLQSEFYFKQFSAVDPGVWVGACQTQATGEHWPSVETLRHCIRQLTPSIPPPASSAYGPEHITKEEFGLNLFEVVKTISGIHTIRQQLNEAVHQEKPTTALAERYQEAKGYLANQLPTLTDGEMAQVLERYPDVVTL